MTVQDNDHRCCAEQVGQRVRAQDESLAANFTELGLDSRFLGVLAGDASLPPWRTDTPWLDCIVTDPPYGIREAVNRVGSNKVNLKIC